MDAEMMSNNCELSNICTQSWSSHEILIEDLLTRLWRLSDGEMIICGLFCTLPEAS